MAYFNDPQEFIDFIAPVAQKVCLDKKVYASVCIAQACIESEYGKTGIGDFNFFGRKWGGWGGYIECGTQEEEDGVMVDTSAKFQDYESLEQAIEDYCALIVEDEKYVTVPAAYGDRNAYIDALAAIYATDSSYATLIKEVISDWGFEQFDIAPEA